MCRSGWRWRAAAGAETLNFDEVDVVEALHETDREPRSRLPAWMWWAWKLPVTAPCLRMDRAKQMARIQTDRPIVLRQAIMACKKGGTVSVPGVYGGFIDKVPMGAFMNKALTMKTGQTHMMRYMQPLLERIQTGEIDPSFVISHTIPHRQRAGRLPDVPRQAGPLHQGRPQALGTADGRLITAAWKETYVSGGIRRYSRCRNSEGHQPYRARHHRLMSRSVLLRCRRALHSIPQQGDWNSERAREERQAA